MSFHVATHSAALALLLAGLAGCSAVFNADFEQDVVGEDPLSQPPGPPRGDSVSVIDSGQPDFRDVTITGSGALIDTKSLVLIGPTGGVTPVVIYTAAPVPDDTRPVTFDYTGRFTAGGGVRLCVSTGAPLCAFVVRLSGGQIIVNDVVAGTYSQNGTHRVLFTLTPSIDGYAFSISGDATITNSDAASGSLPRPDDFPGPTLGLGVRFEDAAIDDTYLMDNVRISIFD